jgi:putative CocE/NonD family hydrolase
VIAAIHRRARYLVLPSFAAFALALASCESPESTSSPAMGASAETTAVPQEPVVRVVAAQDAPAAVATDPAAERRRRFQAAAEAVRENYTKNEYMIPMRDGIKLFTAVYTPKNQSETYPFLMVRSPYSSGPYGADAYRSSLGLETRYMEDGFIFVYQDVRGCYMSEGEFRNMTPHFPDKQSANDVDESSDTYDTIEWLLANVPNHNGKVGQWGISYPGFYCAASMIDHHPALVAVSPQAPIADWWYDDFHHHGAFFLPHAFGFLSGFGLPRPEPTTSRARRTFDYWTRDGYDFYMDMTPLSKANEKYLKGGVPFWNETVNHPNYDEFWQSRNILPHLNNVSPAVMTVGGWYDAEDLYGACKIYRSVEEKNPDIFNIWVMGPWAHGGWSRGDGDRLGLVHFDSKTSEYYRENIQRPFFYHFLKGEGEMNLPEASVFETGANQWRTFDEWPPAQAKQKRLYFQADGGLGWNHPGDEPAFDEYLSDPKKPVPFTDQISRGMTRPYMTDDQRFASRRPDVLVYQTEVLTEDVTLAGTLLSDLWVSTSGTASDWVVKLIDVYPPDFEDYDDTLDRTMMAGFHQMVRSEVIRGRFRYSHEFPEPFVPNQPTHVQLELQDVLHTFKKGHRIMFHVQSTWFPLVDINPHRYAPNVF